MEQAPAPREAAVPQSPVVMVDKIMQTTAQTESVEISEQRDQQTPKPAKHSLLILQQLFLPWMRVSSLSLQTCLF